MSPRLRPTLALVAIALAALLLAACGEKEEPDPERLPGSAGPSIVFTQGGGIAGISRSIEIDPENTVRGSLNGEPARELEIDPALAARARSAVSEIDFAGLDVPAAPPKPDEITVRIVYGSEQVGGSESTLAEYAQLRPALAAFDAILGAATATTPPDGDGSAAGSSSSSP